MPFSSVPSLGMDSSVNLGMPRNEHFLPRNNGSHSESIPRNFVGTKFRCQPYPSVPNNIERGTIYVDCIVTFLYQGFGIDGCIFFVPLVIQ
jgi:hypothetical protein